MAAKERYPACGMTTATRIAALAVLASLTACVTPASGPSVVVATVGDASLPGDVTATDDAGTAGDVTPAYADVDNATSDLTPDMAIDASDVMPEDLAPDELSDAPADISAVQQDVVDDADSVANDTIAVDDTDSAADLIADAGPDTAAVDTVPDAVDTDDGTVAPCPLGCDDGSGCTADLCEPGGCSHIAIAVPCADGNACTLSDKCIAGTCIGGATLPCDDGKVCTADSCKSATGCVHVGIPGCGAPLAPCDATADCSTGTCDVALHGCVPCVVAGDCGVGFACEKHACVAAVVCASDAQCKATQQVCDLSDKICVDCVGPGDCGGSELCVESQCVAAPPCLSSKDCTHVCDKGAGVCVDCISGADCGFDQMCTAWHTCAPVACTVSACVGAKAFACAADGSGYAKGTSCDDANLCTDDTCLSGTGCSHTNNSKTCTDGNNACTTADKCISGACTSQTSKLCDDGSLCTWDSCDPVAGCSHSPQYTIQSCCKPVLWGNDFESGGLQLMTLSTTNGAPNWAISNKKAHSGVNALAITSLTGYFTASAKLPQFTFPTGNSTLTFWLYFDAVPKHDCSTMFGTTDCGASAFGVAIDGKSALYVNTLTPWKQYTIDLGATGGKIPEIVFGFSASTGTSGITYKSDGAGVFVDDIQISSTCQ